jgi:serine/threonine protein kinase
VYYATDKRNGKEVVLKAYHKEVMDERHFLRLAREMRVQKAIQKRASSHVCRLLETFEDETDIYLVLERCLGGDVFALRAETGGTLSEAYVCKVRTHVLESYQLFL